MLPQNLSALTLDYFFELEQSTFTKEDFAITSNELTVSTLTKLHNSSKLLFPSYILRWLSNEDIATLDDKALNVLLESGSKVAYTHMKKEYQTDLNKASDEYLVLRAQEKNRDELEFLTERYRKIIGELVNRIHKKYYITGLTKEDFFQESSLAFLKAIEVYKVERRTKFKEFSDNVIQRHLGTLLNRSKNKRNRTLNESFSYNIPINGNGANDTTHEDLLIGKEATPEKVVVDQYVLNELFERFTDIEHDVYEKFSKGYSYQEIAFKLLQKQEGDSLFDGMNYNDISKGIKLYKSYKKARPEIKKIYAKKAADDVSLLLYELMLDIIPSESIEIDSTLDEIQAHISELDINIPILDNSTCEVFDIKSLIHDVVNQFVYTDLKKTLSKAVQKGKSIQISQRPIRTKLEKTLYPVFYTALSEKLIISNSDIASFVLSLELQVTRNMTKEMIEQDIAEKEAFLTSNGLTWADIALHMKKKQKSVDNTIQRIRHKGTQYLMQDREIERKELLLR